MRATTDASGVWQGGCTGLPFGDGVACNGDIPDSHHFTGKERDTESGNDYFGARYYASTMGRWLSPDWSAKVTPVPYAKLNNPQTLNLYAYGENSPLTGVDVDGHCGENAEFMANSGASLGLAISASCSSTVTTSQISAGMKQAFGPGFEGKLAQALKIIGDRKVQIASYNLFKSSHWGFASMDNTEHSMWVKEGGGQYDTVPWPYSATADKETWRGPVPDGTVADIHSHPDDRGDMPSLTDHNLANGEQTKDFVGPVFVLSRKGIKVALPGESGDPSVRSGFGWVNEFKPKKGEDE